MSAGDDFIHAPCSVNRGMSLVNISQGNGLPCFKDTSVSFLLTHYHTKQRGFAGTVGTYHSHYAVRGKVEVQVFKQYCISECL